MEDIKAYGGFVARMGLNEQDVDRQITNEQKDAVTKVVKEGNDIKEVMRIVQKVRGLNEQGLSKKELKSPKSLIFSEDNDSELELKKELGGELDVEFENDLEKKQALGYTKK
ncbi:hypothetical protein [Bacillus sp. 196mf]|uniref:hypothetical protein n=1 Tax=Bacillus sp. 196mf TaxID=1761754 RepID=UPI000D7C8B62|nr:hypothetical protein [Bacillus sp. 196mf]PYE88564.1 hypothetical protein ATL10_104411 [Bacillus sp. 196mf]